MRKIICISDWATDDLMYHEFATAVAGYAKIPNKLAIHRISSTSSTAQTGFLVEQSSFTEERLGRPAETVIFANTDPRSQSTGSMNATRGAEFLIAKLASGLYVCGPNAGHSLSFIKSKIESVQRYVNFEATYTSRSRDLFSRAVAHLSDYMEDELELEEIHISTIADRPSEKMVLHIDHFGNIVTSISQEELLEKSDFGSYIKVNINHVVVQARIVRDRFGGNPGELVIYPGSYGHPDNPYVEIAVWHDASPHKEIHKKPFSTGVFAGDEINIK